MSFAIAYEMCLEKLAQAYQVIGAMSFYMEEGENPISDAEMVRALDYFADDVAFDPEFLPWPRNAP